jgi:hypothetical protein
LAPTAFLLEQAAEYLLKKLVLDAVVFDKVVNVCAAGDKGGEFKIPGNRGY